MGTENWGKGIGGKAEEIDAELHSMIAEEQYYNPEQNISNWNSLFQYQKDDIIKRLSDKFKSPESNIKKIIDEILQMRKHQN